MSRTNPDGSHDWTNVHDWGTPEQQQANIDAPDERKVTTVTRWAVIANHHDREEAVALGDFRETRESAEAGKSIAETLTDIPCRVVRLDITISEDETTAENDRFPAHGEGV